MRGDRVAEKRPRCEAIWSESVVVGSKDYVLRIGEALGGMARESEVRQTSEGWGLREGYAAYHADSRTKNPVMGGPDWRFGRSNSETTVR